MEIQVIDNFLPDEEFERIRDFVFSSQLGWVKSNGISVGENPNDQQIYFLHPIYDNSQAISPYIEQFNPVLSALNADCLIRAKVNLYLRQDEVKPHGFHSDYAYHHNGCVFYFNTCNGHTHFRDGPSIETVANRAIIFDGSHPHSSSGCTDQPERITMNVNYIKMPTNPGAIIETNG